MDVETGKLPGASSQWQELVATASMTVRQHIEAGTTNLGETGVDQPPAALEVPLSETLTKFIPQSQVFDVTKSLITVPPGPGAPVASPPTFPVQEMSPHYPDCSSSYYPGVTKGQMPGLLGLAAPVVSAPTFPVPRMSPHYPCSSSSYYPAVTKSQMTGPPGPVVPAPAAFRMSSQHAYWSSSHYPAGRTLKTETWIQPSGLEGKVVDESRFSATLQPLAKAETAGQAWPGLLVVTDLALQPKRKPHY